MVIISIIGKPLAWMINGLLLIYELMFNPFKKSKRCVNHISRIELLAADSCASLSKHEERLRHFLSILDNEFTHLQEQHLKNVAVVRILSVHHIGLASTVESLIDKFFESFSSSEEIEISLCNNNVTEALEKIRVCQNVILFEMIASRPKRTAQKCLYRGHELQQCLNILTEIEKASFGLDDKIHKLEALRQGKKEDGLDEVSHLNEFEQNRLNKTSLDVVKSLFSFCSQLTECRAALEEYLMLESQVDLQNRTLENLICSKLQLQEKLKRIEYIFFRSRIEAERNKKCRDLQKLDDIRLALLLKLDTFNASSDVCQTVEGQYPSDMDELVFTCKRLDDTCETLKHDLDNLHSVGLELDEYEETIQEMSQSFQASSSMDNDQLEEFSMMIDGFEELYSEKLSTCISCLQKSDVDRKVIEENLVEFKSQYQRFSGKHEYIELVSCKHGKLFEDVLKLFQEYQDAFTNCGVCIDHFGENLKCLEDYKEVSSSMLSRLSFYESSLHQLKSNLVQADSLVNIVRAQFIEFTSQHTRCQVLKTDVEYAIQEKEEQLMEHTFQIKMKSSHEVGRQFHLLQADFIKNGISFESLTNQFINLVDCLIKSEKELCSKFSSQQLAEFERQISKLEEESEYAENVLCLIDEQVKDSHLFTPDVIERFCEDYQNQICRVPDFRLLYSKLEHELSQKEFVLTDCKLQFEKCTTLLQRLKKWESKNFKLLDSCRDSLNQLGTTLDDSQQLMSMYRLRFQRNERISKLLGGYKSVMKQEQEALETKSNQLDVKCYWLQKIQLKQHPMEEFMEEFVVKLKSWISLQRNGTSHLAWLKEKLEKLENKSDDRNKTIEKLEYMKLSVYNNAKLDDSEVKFNLQTFVCPICSDDVPPGYGVVLSECLHMICKICLTSHVRLLETAKLECPCVNNVTKCGAVIHDRELKAFASEEIYNIHLRRGLSLNEAQTTNSFHCQTPGCDYWVVIEDSIIDGMKCPICKQFNCLQCCAIHKDLTCREYQKFLEKDEALKKSELEIQKKIKNGEAMKCPKCGVIIEKTDGCDGLYCQQCNLQLCWATKGPRWGKGGRGDISGGCRCGVDGKLCHPDCKFCH